MSPSAKQTNRREFLQMGLMGSTMLLGSQSLWARTTEQAQNSVPAYAAFVPLRPGAARATGWLQHSLEMQAEQLGSHLPEVSWPFSAAYWAGEEKGASWWPWEQEAYWIDGAARLALVLDNRKLLAQVQIPIRYTLDHASDGYLGPAFFKDPKGNYHRWPHAIFFRALSALHDADYDPEIAAAMRAHYLSDTADYGTPQRNVINIESMLWCYERTGDEALLKKAETAWREFETITEKRDNPFDLSPLRVFSAGPINAHGVSYIETAKQPAILYMYTGNRAYLDFALAAQRRIFDHHMLIDGVPSTSEYYRTRTSLDSHETCDIVDHMWSWSYLLMATGDGRWGDHIERALFNAGFGAIKKDWKALQYFSCPNQFLATLDSDHNVLEWGKGHSLDGGRMMAYQPNPGQDTACCGGNIHRMLPNYVLRMWMRNTEGGLAAVLYGPSRVQAEVGDQRQKVTIYQKTDYPFGESIHFTIESSEPVSFPLSLRIPAWCASPRLSLNGKAISLPSIDKGFIQLHRTFRPGDIVTLTLPMRVAVSHWPQNGIGIERGPLVYSLPIREEWKPVIEAKYTTKDFPSWNATPTSAWNYGLEIEEGRLGAQIQLHRKPMTDDPWIDPPVRLTLPVRAIPGWKLQQNPDKPTQQFTPPLPEPSAIEVSAARERIALSPYGSTHLRVTIFPHLKPIKAL